MAKWVTFYYGITDGICDYTEHKDRASAEMFFLKNYRRYFALNTDLKKNFKLPMSYGYPHRKFYGMTKHKFDKLFLNNNEVENEP